MERAKNTTYAVWPIFSPVLTGAVAKGGDGEPAEDAASGVAKM